MCEICRIKACASNLELCAIHVQDAHEFSTALVTVLTDVWVQHSASKDIDAFVKDVSDALRAGIMMHPLYNQGDSPTTSTLQ